MMGIPHAGNRSTRAMMDLHFQTHHRMVFDKYLPEFFDWIDKTQDDDIWVIVWRDPGEIRASWARRGAELRGKHTLEHLLRNQSFLADILVARALNVYYIHAGEDLNRTLGADWELEFPEEWPHIGRTSSLDSSGEDGPDSPS